MHRQHIISPGGFKLRCNFSHKQLCLSFNFTRFPCIYLVHVLGHLGKDLTICERKREMLSEWKTFQSLRGWRRSRCCFWHLGISRVFPGPPSAIRGLMDDQPGQQQGALMKWWRSDLGCESKRFWSQEEIVFSQSQPGVRFSLHMVDFLLPGWLFW